MFERFLVVIIALIYSFQSYGTEVRRIGDAVALRAHSDVIKYIAVTPANPSAFATADNNGEIALWDKTTLTPAWRATVGGFSSAVEFSTSGRLLATGGQCVMLLMDTTDGYPIQGFSTRRPNEGGCNINWDEPDRIIFSRDDRSLIAGFTDRVFHFDTTNNSTVRIYGDPMRDDYRFWGLKDVALGNNDLYMYAVDEGDFRAFLLATGELVRTLTFRDIAGLENVKIEQAGIATDGLYATLSSGMYMYVVDVTFGTLVRRTLATADRITSAAMTSDLRSVILSSSDGTTRTYEIATGVELLRLDDNRPRRTWQTAVRAVNGTSETITGDSEGNVYIWKTSGG